MENCTRYVYIPVTNNQLRFVSIVCIAIDSLVSKELVAQYIRQLYRLFLSDIVLL